MSWPPTGLCHPPTGSGQRLPHAPDLGFSGTRSSTGQVPTDGLGEVVEPTESVVIQGVPAAGVWRGTPGRRVAGGGSRGWAAGDLGLSPLSWGL